MTGRRAQPRSTKPQAVFLPAGKLEYATWLLLTSSTLLGGWSFFSGRDNLLALLALVALLFALWPARHEAHFFLRTHVLIAAVLVIGAVPLLYLVKLPIDLIAQLPGRYTMLQPALEQLGPDRWIALSLSSEDTWQAWLKWLPPVAIFVAAVKLPQAARARLLGLVIGVALLQGFLGLAQMSADSQSALRFYGSDEAYRASGTFANRSHYASFLVLCLPLFAKLGHSGGWSRSDSTGARLTGILGLLIVVLAVLASRSRAGVFLMLLEGLVVGIWLLIRGSSMSRLVGTVAALFIMLAVILPFASGNLLGGFEIGHLGSRIDLFRRGFDAARQFFPVGAGPGTFSSVFSSFDSLETLDNVYINRAHNDAIELVFEAGLLGVFLYAACVALVASALWRYARTPANSADSVRWLCALGLSMLLLHGLVDYPMRTPSIAVLAMLFLAQIMAAPSTEHPRFIGRQPARDSSRP
ncbi:MAG: O-antigen ligase family protein [Tahibacter sp.]